MARRVSRFRFTFLGWHDGWYHLRLSTRRLPPLEVHAFRNSVVEWLFENDIILNELAYLANGNTGDGPVVPAAEDGSMLCLLLRQAADVLRFERHFGCRDVNAETIFAALRTEASVHRFVLGDIAMVAHDAIRSLLLVFGDRTPIWDDRSRDEQQFFLQQIREYLEQPDRSVAEMHSAWVDRRVLEGWRYAAQIDLTERQHPTLVPFSKLSDRDQAAIRITASTAVSLAPLLARRS